MIKRLILLIVCLALLIGAGLATSAAVAAEDPLFFGDMTARWDGLKDLDQDSDVDDNGGETRLRSRFGARAWIGAAGLFNLEIENSRVLGGNDADNDELIVHEAWLGLRDLFVSGLDISIGRHSLAYGNERIIGRQDWVLARQGQYRYDGAVGRYECDKGTIDLLCLKLDEAGIGWQEPGIESDTWTQAPEYQQGDRNLRGLYLHRDLGEQAFVEAYGLHRTTANFDDFTVLQNGSTIGVGDSDPDHDTECILGCLLDWDNGEGLHLFGEFVYTTGEMHTPAVDSTGFGVYVVDSVDTLDRSAFACYLGAVYRVDTPAAPFIGIEYDYATGDDEEDDYGAFDGLTGSWSDYLGATDIVGWSNTASFRFSGGATPIEKLDVRADYWIFRLATDADTARAGDGSFLAGVLNDDGVYDKAVGTEFDLALDYRHTDEVGFIGGFGIFSRGDYFGEGDSDATCYGWLGAHLAFD